MRGSPGETPGPPREGSSAEEAPSRGGILLRYWDPLGSATTQATTAEEHHARSRLGFLPLDVGRRVATLSSFTPVPGAPALVAGVALADGAVVTVLWVGPEADGPDRRQGIQGPAVLCDIEAPGGRGRVTVALAGAVALETGFFEALGADRIRFFDDVVDILDVAALYRVAAEAAVRVARTASPTTLAERSS